jgi:uncharacterized membrane protein YpjA
MSEIQDRKFLIHPVNYFFAINLLSLAKIYGFWRYTTNLEMTELHAYLDLMYHTLYKPGEDD